MHAAKSASIGAICLGLLALVGCGSETSDLPPPRVVDYQTPVAEALYASDVTFKFVEDVPLEKGDLPVALYLGLAPETQTRLLGHGVVDLRALQQALPERLSQSLEPSCSLGLDVDFGGAEARGDMVMAQASVDVRLYRCRDRDTATEARGARLFTQSIDAVAQARMDLEGQCIAFQLTDLALRPRGVLGGLATLIGVTERAREAILREAETVLADNVICPDLPPALELLDLQISDVHLREIGTGGVGARAVATVDMRASNLVDLLAFAEAGTSSGPGVGTNLKFDQSVSLRGNDLNIGLNMDLQAESATRIALAALMDLREIQADLNILLPEEPLLDNCGARVTLDSLAAEGRDQNVRATGTMQVDTFECLRTGAGSWERGPVTLSESVAVQAEVSATSRDRCIVFELIDLRRDPPGPLGGDVDTGNGRIMAARVLLLEAIGLILEASPLCPDLPPEIDIFEPRMASASPQEIDAGGLGVALAGSLDTSPQTLVAVLRELQKTGVLPPAP